MDAYKLQDTYSSRPQLSQIQLPTLTNNNHASFMLYSCNYEPASETF